MSNIPLGFVIAGFPSCFEGLATLICFSLASAIRYLHCYDCLWFCRLKITIFYLQQGYYFFQLIGRLMQAI